MESLEAEIRARVAIMREDDGYMIDNGNPDDAELRVHALEDIVAMGNDYGGHAAFASPAECAEWKKLREAARRELRGTAK